MDLFPKSPKDMFRRRVYVRESESDILENLVKSPKWFLQQWERVVQHPIENNNTALEREMEQTFGQVNDFLHQLEVSAKVHSKKNSVKYRDWKKLQANERDFKDRVKLGHTLMGKMKELLELDESGLRLMKSYDTLSNNYFTLTNSFGSIEESVGNISQSSRHSSEIRGVLRKFNQVLNLPGEVMSSLKLQDLPFEEETRNSSMPSSEQECLEFLTDHLAKDNIQLNWQTLPCKESQSTLTVTCKVFNITVEGNASEKTAAKKCAAIKMLERLVKDSIKKCLPHQISAFTKEEIKEAINILCQTESYDSKLEEYCREHRKPQPRYFAETEQNQVQVLCSALGFQSISCHKVLMVAKRAAAWNILQLIEKRSRY